MSIPGGRREENGRKRLAINKQTTAVAIAPRLSSFSFSFNNNNYTLSNCLLNEEEEANGGTNRRPVSMGTARHSTRMEQQSPSTVPLSVR